MTGYTHHLENVLRQHRDGIKLGTLKGWRSEQLFELVVRRRCLGSVNDIADLQLIQSSFLIIGL